MCPEPRLPITLATDASAYGVDTVISHVFPDGSEHPIAFAWQPVKGTMPSCRRKHCHWFLCEEIPLIAIWSEVHPCNRSQTTDNYPRAKEEYTITGSCLFTKWAVLLSAHDYNICYKSTTDHGNANGLSILPLPSATPLMDTSNATSFNIGQIQALPVIFQDIQKATRHDAILATSMCKKDGKIKL